MLNAAFRKTKGDIVDDIRMIVGELKGEFKGVNKRLDDIGEKVEALQTDFNQRKFIGKIGKWFFSIGSLGGIGAGLKAACVSLGIIH